MRATRRARGIVVLVALGAGLVGGPARAAADDDGGAAAVVYENAVSVAVDSEAGGAMTGVVTNSGSRAVRDVRLLIRHVWLWKNERNPGPRSANPGRSAYYVVDGEIPPNGEIRFRYAPSPPLPSRTDGSFMTTAEVVSLTEVTAAE